MNASATLLPVLIPTTVEDRAWPSSDHCASPVLVLLSGLGWAIVHTPDANVHAVSPDGRLYVGWLPEDKTAWQRDVVWTVRVTPAGPKPWVQEFGPGTPSEAVAAFLSALIAHPTR